MGYKKSSNHNQANKNKNTDTVSARNDYVDAEEAAAVGPGEDEVQRKTDPGEGQSVFVKDLNVTTDSGQRILQDVSINLKGSTFTGLLGEYRIPKDFS